MLPRLLILASALSLLSACASSPVDYQKRSGAAKAATLAAGAAGGAAIGSQIDSQYGAAGGAVAGLAVGYLADKIADNSSERIRAEAYEQGKREERVRVMNKYWEEKTLSLQTGSSSEGRIVEAPIPYEAGVYEGVRMLPRVEMVQASALNGEPRR